MVERLGARDGGAEVWNDADLEAEAAAVVAETASAGARMPGYGIPLHGADPRAPAVLGIARNENVFGPYCRFATAIEAALSAARGGRAVPMNLDGVSAAVALDLGFDWRATRMFLLTPRSVSMGAHYLEEQAQDTIWRHIPADQIDYHGD
jgi:citrate synthase